MKKQISPSSPKATAPRFLREAMYDLPKNPKITGLLGPRKAGHGGRPQLMSSPENPGQFREV